MMDSGFPLTPSTSDTHPMVFAHFMGTNPPVFPSDMQNHNTQLAPWVSNHLSLGMLEISSHLPSSPSPSYMNPSFRTRGMMPPFSTFSFDGSHIPQ
jgi:hypothetical protein